LRELLSNASDALEKQRFRRMTGESKTEDELKIQVTLDEAKRVITIFDTGCGMSRDTLIQDLGTIARSGSQAFVSEQKNKAD
jgi:HSP90 family molecular chaperone